jgi:hypothetical protein
LIADHYAGAVRDETWIAGTLVESRVIHGEAGRHGNEIVATDRLSNRALGQACDAEIARVREVAREIRDARVRIVVRSTSEEPLTSTVGITIGALSVVTTPQFAIEDAARLRVAAESPASEFRPGLPLAWHDGTAAILLHEAEGHAHEHGQRRLEWPRWLKADIEHTMRRETFRDTPLLRMTNVFVRQSGAPFALPGERVDIRFISGGSYEPLTEMVTIDVAVPRFTIRATRTEIARSLLGATGDPLRYPGVICSREGQELFVGSYAPLIVTRSFS